MPILQPTSELVINREATQALGLTAPSGALAIADEVIQHQVTSIFVETTILYLSMLACLFSIRSHSAMIGNATQNNGTEVRT
jgi:hypothetical protein